jgi:hypothetical protein
MLGAPRRRPSGPTPATNSWWQRWWHQRGHRFPRHLHRARGQQAATGPGPPCRRPRPPQHGGDSLGRGPHRRGIPARRRAGLGRAAANPFSGDGLAIGRFLQGLAEGRYTPEVFTDDPSNTFAGRDATAIALQLPDAAFGSTRIGLRARISLSGDGHAPQRQVSRIGQAMLRPLFFNPPDTEAQLDALNTGAPATDRDIHGERVGRIAATAARLAGLADPDGHAARVAVEARKRLRAAPCHPGVPVPVRSPAGRASTPPRRLSVSARSRPMRRTTTSG